MTFLTGQPITAVMADLATFIPARAQPRGPVETFSTERSRRHGRARDGDRGRRVDPAPLRQRRARRRVASRRSAPAARTRSSGRSTGRPARRPGTRRRRTTSGSATASGRTRSCCANPGPDGPGRSGGGGPARRPRRGLRRHVRGALPGRSTRTSPPAGPPSGRRTRPSPTATTRCSSATPSPRARGSVAGSRSHASPRRPPTSAPFVIRP